MIHKKTHDSALLGFTVVAALMGLGFATAVGAATYVPQKSASQGARSSYENDIYVPMEHVLPNGDVLQVLREVEYAGAQRYTDVLAVPAQEASYEDLFHFHTQSMEEVLRLGDYEEWTAYIEQHPRIGEVILEDEFTRFVEARETRWRE